MSGFLAGQQKGISTTLGAQQRQLGSPQLLAHRLQAGSRSEGLFRHQQHLPLLSPCHQQRQQPPPPQAIAGGGGGASGTYSGGGSGGGGGGGDGFSSGGDSEGSGKSGLPLAGILAGWRDRVAYDPEFPLKVLMEQVIGVSASVVGDMSSRPNWGLYELDLVFATLVVGSILNFIIMYLLAPTAAVAASGGASGGLLQRILSESILKSWGAPGANMFEPGAYSVGKRLLNFAYKGGVFGVIGFIAGLVGTATSNSLLAMRKAMDPSFQTQNEAPDILFNAVTWAVHMGVSANLRYQMLGGADRILYGVMPLTIFRIYQGLIRGANNIVGGISFVTLARVLGSQKSSNTATTAVAVVDADGVASVPVMVVRKESK